MKYSSCCPGFLFKTGCSAVIACIAVLCICCSTQAAETNAFQSAKHGSVTETAAPSTNGIAAALPKLVDLGAKKCIPCKKLAPILEKLEKDFAGVLTVEFIDVWLPENKGTAEQYGIDTIPTQIFFDPQGKELWRHVGFISREDILAQWKKLGYDLKPKIKDTGNVKPSATHK